MLKAEREREFKMKAKLNKRNRKAKLRLFVMLICITAITITVVAKGNQPKIVGYIHDSGSTVWEMAQKHCPEDMDVRDFAREIERANGIKNSTVYEHCTYKIPVYESKSDYLDMNTVVGYEVSDEGVLLVTNDGNGYFIEK